MCTKTVVWIGSLGYFCHDSWLKFCLGWGKKKRVLVLGQLQKQTPKFVPVWSQAHILSSVVIKSFESVMKSRIVSAKVRAAQMKSQNTAEHKYILNFPSISKKVSPVSFHSLFYLPPVASRRGQRHFELWDQVCNFKRPLWWRKHLLEDAGVNFHQVKETKCVQSFSKSVKTTIKKITKGECYSEMEHVYV